MRPPRIFVGMALLGLVVTAAAFGIRLHSGQSSTAKVQETYGRLPLSFEANQGQSDAEVQFLARGRGYTLFLTPTEAVFAFRKPPAKPLTQLFITGEKVRHDGPDRVLHMKLVGANPQSPVTGVEELPGKVNYFIGNDPQKWRTNIPTFAKVHYHEVYPGVDAVYYGNQQQLEYDFVVAPGADPKLITLGFQGADKVKVDAEGHLVLYVGGKQIRQHKPVIFQYAADGRRQEIAGGYVLKGKRQVSFQVAAYDTAEPLVIDPVLVYSTYLGGGGNDVGFGLAVDAAGSAYLTGVTVSTDFPTMNPAQPTLSGAEDAFVTKLDPTGTALVYSTYLGGSDTDAGFGLAVDGDGNAYISGVTASPNFPTMNALQPMFGGGPFDAFVAKLDPTGSVLVYSTYLGGSNIDFGHGIAVDAAGSAYVTGRTFSTNFPTLNPLQPTLGGSGDAFVAKLDPTGAALVYSTYLGGSAFDMGMGIAVDGAGNAYVSGVTLSTNFPIMNPFQPTLGGDHDAFVAKLDPTGAALVYSTYLGGSAFDMGIGIAVDGAGNAYVTGITVSTNFPTMNPFQPVFGGSSDAFVAKLDPTGAALVYSTYLGGSNTDEGYGIAVDGAGNAYVSGITLSTNFPTMNPFQAMFGGGVDDAFVAKLDPTGAALVYSTYLGGSDNDEGYGIAVDADGNVYMAGLTLSTNFPTMNPFQSTIGGGSDAFVAKIAP